MAMFDLTRRRVVALGATVFASGAARSKEATAVVSNGGARVYPQTEAERKSGILPTDLGYGTAPYDVRRYGAVGDGVTNDAAALNKAFSVGGDCLIPSGMNCFLGTSILVVGVENTRVAMAKNSQFSVATSSAAAMPADYLQITASGVTLDGLTLDLGSSPFVSGKYTYGPNGGFIAIHGNRLSDITIENCVANHCLHGVRSVCTGERPASSIANLVIRNNRFCTVDTGIYWTAISPFSIKVYGNCFSAAKNVFFRNGGAIFIAPSVALEDPAAFTEEMYKNAFGSGVEIFGNCVTQVVGRPIRIHNSVGVNVYGNTVILNKGTYNPNLPTNLFSADVLTLDMVRGFSVTGNTIEGGGENGVDILSSQDGTVTGNTIKQANTTGVFVGFSDVYNSARTVFTNKKQLLNRNIKITGNEIEAFFPYQYLQGQNVRFNGNQLKFWRGSTNWAMGTVEPTLMLFDNSTTPSSSFYGTRGAIDGSLLPDGLDFSCNCHSTYARKICIFGSSNVIKSVEANGTASLHEYVTGDKIEFAAGGAVATFTFPSGVSFSADYYVISLSPTTFSIATSWTKAFAGIATTTGVFANADPSKGGVIYACEALGRTQLNFAPAYYNANADIALDQIAPFNAVVTAFDSLGAFSTGVEFNFKHVHNEMVLNPAKAYHSSGRKESYGKYWPIAPMKYSDGISTYGIEVNGIGPAVISVLTGARPSVLSGSSSAEAIRTRFY